MPSSRVSSQPRDQIHVSYVSLLLWQAGSLSLAPPQKLSSPAEFMINLPIQKSIPFLFSSYLNPVLNSTLTILEYYKKLLTMIV